MKYENNVDIFYIYNNYYIYYNQDIIKYVKQKLN